MQVSLIPCRQINEIAAKQSRWAAVLAVMKPQKILQLLPLDTLTYLSAKLLGIHH